MSRSRRDFSLRLLGAGLGVGLAARPAFAESAPVEGVNYLRLAEPVAAGLGTKVEVIEFFWYECPHCNAFEPVLDAWHKRLPDDVVLRRVPVWFKENPFAAQQRLFYALETLGLVETMHRKVFSAIHDGHVSLRGPEEIAAFMLNSGVDVQKFMAAYASFAVRAKAQQARQTAAAYRVEGVPAMGVQGRWLTNGDLASAGQPRQTAAAGNDRILVVVDALTARARGGSKA